MNSKVTFWVVLAVLALALAFVVDYPGNVLFLAFTGICTGLAIRDYRISRA